MDDIEEKAIAMVQESAPMTEVIRELDVDILDWLGLPDTPGNRSHARRAAHECYMRAVEWVQ